ncbi:hypothetical protein NG2371_02485 [Nocardia gamkensis]|nr:hypothetical protein [Nocardia gamkensis]
MGQPGRRGDRPRTRGPDRARGGPAPDGRSHSARRAGPDVAGCARAPRPGAGFPGRAGLGRPRRSCRARQRAGVSRRGPKSARPSRSRTRSGVAATRRAGRGRHPGLVCERRRRRGAVRRRDVGGGWCRTPMRRRLRRGRGPRHRPHGPDHRTRPHQPGGADPSGHSRSGAGSGLTAGGPDPPALPAVVRVLDARRLAGHPGGRPLRDRLYPHRRHGRIDAGGDPGRDQ